MPFPTRRPEKLRFGDLMLRCCDFILFGCVLRMEVLFEGRLCWNCMFRACCGGRFVKDSGDVNKIFRSFLQKNNAVLRGLLLASTMFKFPQILARVQLLLVTFPRRFDTSVQGESAYQRRRRCGKIQSARHHRSRCGRVICDNDREENCSWHDFRCKTACDLRHKKFAQARSMKGKTV